MWINTLEGWGLLWGSRGTSSPLAGHPLCPQLWRSQHPPRPTEHWAAKRFPAAKSSPQAGKPPQGSKKGWWAFSHPWIPLLLGCGCSSPEFSIIAQVEGSFFFFLIQLFAGYRWALNWCFGEKLASVGAGLSQSSMPADPVLNAPPGPSTCGWLAYSVLFTDIAMRVFLRKLIRSMKKQSHMFSLSYLCTLFKGICWVSLDMCFVHLAVFSWLKKLNVMLLENNKKYSPLLPASIQSGRFQVRACVHVSVTLISFVRQRHEECFTVQLRLEKDTTRQPLTRVKRRRWHVYLHTFGYFMRPWR